MIMSISPLAAILLAIAVSIPTASQAPQRASDRTRDIYVSAVDAKGAPVTGLGVADFKVREDGVAREVLKVAPATAPMQVMLLVDDSQAAGSAIHDLREALVAFADKMQGHAEVGLVTIGERPTSVVSSTPNMNAVKNGISRIFARPGAGTYFTEAVLDVTQSLQKRKAERPVIVAIAMEGVEFSNLPYPRVLELLYASGATLHVLEVGPPNTSIDDETHNRNVVMAEGTTNTGGRRDQVLSQIALPGRLRQLADEVLNQYVVTYARPETLIPPEKIQVTTTRPGLTVRARKRTAGR
jgi:VWFA-related protein